MLRRLRIAASVFFAVLTVLVCVLWAKSYYAWDVIEITTKNGTVHLESAIGLVGLEHCDQKCPLDDMCGGRTFTSFSLNDMTLKPPVTCFGFSCNQDDGVFVSVPWWFPVVVCTLLAAAPWFHLSAIRLRLRTMFIAVTVVAVVLGLVAWLAK